MENSCIKSMRMTRILIKGGGMAIARIKQQQNKHAKKSIYSIFKVPQNTLKIKKLSCFNANRGDYLVLHLAQGWPGNNDS